MKHFEFKIGDRDYDPQVVKTVFMIVKDEFINEASVSINYEKCDKIMRTLGLDYKRWLYYLRSRSLPDFSA